MRPDRFLKHLTATATTIPGVTRAEQVPDDERSKRPYLLAVEGGGKTTRWQVEPRHREVHRQQQERPEDEAHGNGTQVSEHGKQKAQRHARRPARKSNYAALMAADN
jgi:hypothetical protein